MMIIESSDTVVVDQNNPNNLTIYRAPRTKRPVLIQYSGASIGKRYLISFKEVLIGRLLINTERIDTSLIGNEDQIKFLPQKKEIMLNIPDEKKILLDDPTVSKKHAKIYNYADKVEIEDLKSSNGTYINEKKLEPNKRYELKDGDLIKLGNIVLKFYKEETIDVIVQDKILQKATIDGGTGIFNKAYLIEALNWEFKISHVYRRPLSIILYDLDFFKKVNDTYGHSCGDFILKESAKVVKSVIRKDDIFGRYGGEEFCVILPGTDSTQAYELAERIRVAHEQHIFSFKDLTLKQTISVGVAQVNVEMKSYEDLIEAADKKLYESKQKGRNTVNV